MKFLKICFPGRLGTHYARYPLSQCRFLCVDPVGSIRTGAGIGIGISIVISVRMTSACRCYLFLVWCLLFEVIGATMCLYDAFEVRIVPHQQLMC